MGCIGQIEAGCIHNFDLSVICQGKKINSLHNFYDVYIFEKLILIVQMRSCRSVLWAELINMRVWWRFSIMVVGHQFVVMAGTM